MGVGGGGGGAWGGVLTQGWKERGLVMGEVAMGEAVAGGAGSGDETAPREADGESP